jgi:hypothetical protein
MRVLKTICMILALSAVCGCATDSRQPLAYLSLEKPVGVIHTAKDKEVKKSFSRGGWYIGNYNFRPAADVESYLAQAHKEANTTVLRNADLQLNVPTFFDILFFGYNHADDSVFLKPEVHAQK